MAPSTDTEPLAGELVHRSFRVEYGKWVAFSVKCASEGRGVARVLRALVDGYIRGDFKV